MRRGVPLVLMGQAYLKKRRVRPDICAERFPNSHVFMNPMIFRNYHLLWVLFPEGGTYNMKRDPLCGTARKEN